MTNLRTWKVADLDISNQFKTKRSAPSKRNEQKKLRNAQERDGERAQEERNAEMEEESEQTHIIILPQAKELANLSRPLRPQPLRQHLIRETRNLLLALLHNTQRQHGQIHRDNAPPDALPLPLASPPRPIAAVSRAQQQAHARGVHDPLLHGEALLVVAAGDLEDVAFEFGSHAVAFDFLAHAFFHEAAQFALVFDFDQLLGAIGWVGDVELHLDGCGGWDVKMVEVGLCGEN